MIRYYKMTDVSTSRSQESIERFLRHFGILETRFTNTVEQIIFEFNYPLQKGDKNLKVGVLGFLKGNVNKNYRLPFEMLYGVLKSKKRGYMKKN